MSEALEGTLAMTPFQRQLADLQSRYPATTAQASPGGTLVIVPAVILPAGWSKPTSSIRYVVPPAYPHANPDCFFADADLRLATGAIPQNAEIQNPAGLGQVLWFSWHVNGAWRPNKDTLSSWMGSIMNRLSQLQ